MRLAIETVLVLGAMLAAGCTSGGPTKPNPIPLGDYGYVIEFAEHIARKAMREHNLPSIAVALVDGDNIVFREAYGLADIENDVPATTDTVYRMWSVSKVFTALAAMRLVERDAVDLDEPITTYLPEFTTRDHQAEPITVRHLLTHHSGLPRNGCVHVTDDVYGFDVLRVIAESTADCYLAYPTGERFKYSNLAINILGHILQRQDGVDFPGHMAQEWLQPLGMNSSGFHSTQIPAESVTALGYEFYRGRYHPYSQYDVPDFASGNLHATLRDMTGFTRFMLGSGAVDGAQLLAEETLASMFERQLGASDHQQPMGLGWKLGTLDGVKTLAWHDGGPSEGTGSLVALLPDSNLGVVLIANGTSFDGSVSVLLARDLLREMFETKFGAPHISRHSESGMSTEPEALARHEGRYIIFGNVMTVELDGDELEAEINGMTLALMPDGVNRFLVSHWLDRLGLMGLFSTPIDLDELRIEFIPPTGQTRGGIAVVAGDIAYEYGDRYPQFGQMPPEWAKTHWQVGHPPAPVSAPCGSRAHWQC